MCSPEYTGDACEVEVRCPKDCRGNGLCFGGQCLCYPGYEGSECEATRACEESCNSHGVCRHDQCFCPNPNTNPNPHPHPNPDDHCGTQGDITHVLRKVT